MSVFPPLTSAHGVRSALRLPRSRSFSLLEVLLAVAILGLALGAILTITGRAKSSFIRARERWGKQHSVEQATEYFLLTDPDDFSLPEGLLPPGYRATCELEPADEGNLPEYAVNPEKGWILGVYHIQVYDDQGLFLGENRIYKLVREEAF